MSIPIKQNALDYSVYTGGVIDHLYDITDQDVIRLYYFFKHNSSDNSYVIVDDGDIARGISFITVDNYSLYCSYNITFASDNLMNLDSKKLYILSPEDLQDSLSFKRYLERHGVKNSVNSTFIVEKDYSIVASSERERDQAIFEQCCNLGTVLNPKFKLTESEFLTSSQRLHRLASASVKKFVQLDVTELLHEVGQTLTVSSTLQKSMEIVEEIDQRVYTLAQNNNVLKDNIIIYVEDSLHSKDMYVYVGIAAYLTMSRGYHCFVNDDYKVACMDILRKTTSPVYNYLSDYLKIIANFPTFSLSMAGNLACLCIKDFAALQMDMDNPYRLRKYRLTLSIYLAPFDINSFSLQGSVSRNAVILDYDNIEVLDFRDYLDFSSKDLETCSNQYRILNSLVQEIDEQLRTQSTVLNEATLNCNNLLLFRQDDRYYVGYVSNVEYKLPFIVKPFASNYKVVKEVMSIHDLNKLYDTNIIFDANIIVNKIIDSNKAYNVNKHFDLNKTALKGCILHGISSSKEKIQNLDVLSFSEIGIWSWQTSSLRDSHVGAIAKKMNIGALLKKEYLGYFGGIHPSEKITMRISPELWR